MSDEAEIGTLSTDAELTNYTLMGFGLSSDSLYYQKIDTPNKLDLIEAAISASQGDRDEMLYGTGLKGTTDEKISIKLYAIWGKKYKVAYSVSGQSGVNLPQSATDENSSSNRYLQGVSFNVVSDEPTIANNIPLIFNGWKVVEGTISRTANGAQISSSEVIKPGTTLYVKESDSDILLAADYAEAYILTVEKGETSVSDNALQGLSKKVKSTENRIKLDSVQSPAENEIIVGYRLTTSGNNLIEPANPTNGIYECGSTITLHDSVYLELVKETGYTVTYDGAGTDVTGVPDIQNIRGVGNVSLGELADGSRMERTGYSFDGWKVKAGSGANINGKNDGDTISQADLPLSITGNISLEAVWTENQYRIEYVLLDRDGYAVSENIPGLGTLKMSDSGGQTTLAALPTNVKGYQVFGWFKTESEAMGASDKSTGIESITVEDLESGRGGYDFRYGVVTVYARLSPKTYTVKYINSATNKEVKATSLGLAKAASSYTVGSDINLSGITPTLKGYNFKGWSKDSAGSASINGIYESFIPETGDEITIYACFQKMNYTVKYDPSGKSTTFADNKGDYYGAVTLPADPNLSNTVLKGFRFENEKDALYGPGETVSINEILDHYSSSANLVYYGGNDGTTDSFEITLYAVWASSYSVKYENGSGTSMTLPNITHKTDGDSYTVEDATEVATGSILNYWDVTGIYKDKSGQTVSGGSVKPGEKITIIGDLVLTANVTEGAKVTYSVGEGKDETKCNFKNSVKSYSAAEKANITLVPENPTCEGYEFAGWKVTPTGGSSVKVTIGSSVHDVSSTGITLATSTKTIGTDGDVTLTATWTASTYKLVYNSNASVIAEGLRPSVTTLDENTNVNVTDTALDISQAASEFTVTGYELIGWSAVPMAALKNGKNVDEKNKYNYIATNEKIDISSLYSYAKGSTITLYAAWKEQAYSINFNNNGETVTTISSESLTAAKHTIASDTQPTKTGRTLLGWSTSRLAEAPDFAASGGFNVAQVLAKYIEKDAIIENDSLNLYAVWGPGTVIPIDSSNVKTYFVLKEDGQVFQNTDSTPLRKDCNDTLSVEKATTFPSDIANYNTSKAKVKAIGAAGNTWPEPGSYSIEITELPKADVFSYAYSGMKIGTVTILADTKDSVSLNNMATGTSNEDLAQSLDKNGNITKDSVAVTNAQSTVNTMADALNSSANSEVAGNIFDAIEEKSAAETGIQTMLSLEVEPKKEEEIDDDILEALNDEILNQTTNAEKEAEAAQDSADGETATDKPKVEAAAFLDISIFAQYTSNTHEEPQNLTDAEGKDITVKETKTPITFKVAVPKKASPSINPPANGRTRKFNVLRYHESSSGEKKVDTLLKAYKEILEGQDEVVEFESDQFSTFVLVYMDSAPNPEIPDPTPASTDSELAVTLNKTALTLKIGESETLTATVTPKTADTSVTWDSDDESVATVDGSGLVKALTTGTAIITATSVEDSTKKANCTVKVVDNYTLKIGDISFKAGSLKDSAELNSLIAEKAERYKNGKAETPPVKVSADDITNVTYVDKNGERATATKVRTESGSYVGTVSYRHEDITSNSDENVVKITVTAADEETDENQDGEGDPKPSVTYSMSIEGPVSVSQNSSEDKLREEILKKTKVEKIQGDTRTTVPLSKSDLVVAAKDGSSLKARLSESENFIVTVTYNKEEGVSSETLVTVIASNKADEDKIDSDTEGKAQSVYKLTAGSKVSIPQGSSKDALKDEILKTVKVVSINGEAEVDVPYEKADIDVSPKAGGEIEELLQGTESFAAIVTYNKAEDVFAETTVEILPKTPDKEDGSEETKAIYKLTVDPSVLVQQGASEGELKNEVQKATKVISINGTKETLVNISWNDLDITAKDGGNIEALLKGTDSFIVSVSYNKAEGAYADTTVKILPKADDNEDETQDAYKLTIESLIQVQQNSSEEELENLIFKSTKVVRTNGTNETPVTIAEADLDITAKDGGDIAELLKKTDSFVVTVSYNKAEEAFQDTTVQVLPETTEYRETQKEGEESPSYRLSTANVSISRNSSEDELKSKFLLITTVVSINASGETEIELGAADIDIAAKDGESLAAKLSASENFAVTVSYNKAAGVFADAWVEIEESAADSNLAAPSSNVIPVKLNSVGEIISTNIAGTVIYYPKSVPYLGQNWKKLLKGTKDIIYAMDNGQRIGVKKISIKNGMKPGNALVTAITLDNGKKLKKSDIAGQITFQIASYKISAENAANALTGSPKLNKKGQVKGLKCTFQNETGITAGKARKISPKMTSFDSSKNEVVFSGYFEGSVPKNLINLQ
ncbi:MAG: InlB B-repeat-containing protein [Lachnospiraceae bacterium]|nr:InlB B-repeat-containing protein [Lachnospiraceae bacterium]